MGIPTEQLKKSFDQYNEYAKAGTDPHGKIFFTNTPIEIGDSFYVAQVTPIVHYTMGGLAISPKAECVYDKTSRVIPGLYAAGELAGGVHGLNRLGGSALLECVVFGRVAGKHSLDFINKPKPATTGAGSTTTVKIPLSDGGEITITHTTGGATAVAEEGEKVDVIEWNDASTTEVGKLTAVADGKGSDKGDDKADDSQAAAAPAAAPAAATGGQDVAVVVGSFFMGDSKRDAEEIVKAFPAESDGLKAPVATAGNDFDFNSP